MSPEAVLQKHWGYPSFRAGQAEVVAAAVDGRDVLAILPTGGGKSICYQVPALVREGVTLVVSPLIALMQDQVAGLQARSIPATFINSTLPRHEIDQRWTDAEFGRYRLVYVAPERLESEMFLARAERLNVSLLAVDEAHCISEWGHHFRPAYLRIAQARAALNEPPILAVTATATPEVRRDIREHLALRDPFVLVKGFDRPNLIWSIFREENKRHKVLDVVRAVEGTGIIYAATRRSVEAWAAWLAQQGFSVGAYHGGLPAASREAVQADWISGATRLMVATNAFGMGIDKPDVRFVIHAEMPGTLEGYYQEAGRGGRDGRPAYAVLLFQPKDEQTQRQLIEESHPTAQEVQHVYQAVCNLAQLPLGSLPDGPVSLDLDAVARLTKLSAGRIRTAIDLLVRQETWQRLPQRRHHGLVRFRQPADAIRRYADGLENQSLAGFVRELLRNVHADAFADWWSLDLRPLARRTKLPRTRLLKGLAFLQNHGLLDWRSPDAALQVLFNEPRSRTIPIDDRAVRRARRRAEHRLDAMHRYARSVTCRRHFLLTYFGEASPPRCGTCDVCVGRHRPVVITPKDEPVMRQILHAVAHDTPRADWFGETLPAPLYQIEGMIDWLVQEGYLRLTDPFEEHFSITEKAARFVEQWQPRPPSA